LILYVDVIGGAAGDMLLAALIDAGAPIGDVQVAVDAVVPGRFRVGTEEVRRGGFRARLLVAGGAEGGKLPPRPFSDLLAAVEGAALSEPVKVRARSVLMRLGEAEARVHGIALAGLSVHELGDDDTLLDVVGVAAALDSLGVERIHVSSIPMGSHSGPATLELLKGFDLEGGGSGETITPTAAAVLAALASPSREFPAMTVEGVGYGAGTRDPVGVANVVRVIFGTDSRTGDAAVRELCVLEANLDDLTPELVADAVQALFAAGALDAWTAPVVMKKGRLGVLLSALCAPEAEARMRKVFFEATSTFGVRSHIVRRAELERRVVSVDVEGGSVRVKVGLLGGRAVSSKPEHDDVAELAASLGRTVREVYEEAAAAARALRFASADGG
jgi:uncharacterized protein (TIGR00299 family) protein